jgi:glycine/D-amino acid oxidase-like deaminating enzyme
VSLFVIYNRSPCECPKIDHRFFAASSLLQISFCFLKADAGRIVIAATVETGSFDPNVTPTDITLCMRCSWYIRYMDHGQICLLEALRQATPDKGPIIFGGEMSLQNFYLTGGYWRNGVLLAPKQEDFE